MKSLLFIFTLLLSTATLAAESASHRAEAERLLELSGTKTAMEQMQQITLQQLLLQTPSLGPFKHVLESHFNKHLSFDSMKDEYIDLYVESFSEGELKQLNEFYSSAVGQKAVSKLPVLMQKGSEIGARRAQESMAELQAAIQAEASRLMEAQATEEDNSQY